MKHFIIVLIVFMGSSCKQHNSTDIRNTGLCIIPNKFILKSSDDINENNDVVLYKGEKYTGYLYLLNASKKDTLTMEGYIDGRLNGVCKKWYPNNQLMEERYYLAGQKSGKQIAYWANGNKRFEFTAFRDSYEGEMKEWDEEGSLFHLAHFVNGQEEGVQKLWYDNGKIRANYIIINGKRYGLLGTKNCKNVSDSIFVVK